MCDNLADHMVGSVYTKFKDENDAAKAMQVCTLCSCSLSIACDLDNLSLFLNNQNF